MSDPSIPLHVNVVYGYPLRVASQNSNKEIRRNYNVDGLGVNTHLNHLQIHVCVKNKVINLLSLWKNSKTYCFSILISRPSQLFLSFATPAVNNRLHQIKKRPKQHQNKKNRETYILYDIHSSVIQKNQTFWI